MMAIIIRLLSKYGSAYDINTSLASGLEPDGWQMIIEIMKILWILLSIIIDDESAIVYKPMKIHNWQNRMKNTSYPTHS